MIDRIALVLLAALACYGIVWLWTSPEPAAVVDLY